MSAVVQAIRGMNDLLPDDTSMWQQVEKVLRETVQASLRISGNAHAYS